MRLQIVKNGSILFWPDGPPFDARKRGEAGTVVDLDAPLEGDFLKGQLHKLMEAPEGSEADTVKDGDAQRLLFDRERAEPQGEPAEQVAAEALKGGPGLVGEIMAPETAKAQSGAHLADELLSELDAASTPNPEPEQAKP